MEDASSTTDTHESGNESTDGSSPLVQLQKVYEPTYLSFHVCTTPLTKLRRTTVHDLWANRPRTGCCLLLRTVGPIFRGTTYSEFGQNATFQVEDHAKNRSGCCLHGYVHLKSERELADLLPVNTVFVLKEPSLAVSSEKNSTVVVGSPSDFIVIGRSHVLYEHAESLGWREKTEDDGVQLTSKWIQTGDDLFEKGKYQEACDAYIFALKNAGDNETYLLLNVKLVKCYFLQDCYESAIRHAFLALRVWPLCEWALYLTGRALYELGDFSNAKLCFERLTHVLPSKEHVLGELRRCEYRLDESKGNVDIHKLILASLSSPKAIDVGSFVGDLEFRPGPGNERRGVFATKDLEPGTLILVEKPIVAFKDASQSPNHGISELVRSVLTTALKNPVTLGRKLYCLPAGGIQTDANRRTFCDEVRELEPIVDASLLYQVVYKNNFKKTDTTASPPSFTHLVYDLASLFRHSCLSNCTFAIYKNVITVRTCSPVQKGDELLLRYYHNRLPFREKQKALERQGLTCSCVLCVLDKMELNEVHDLRATLTSRFYSEIGLHVNVSSQAEEYLLVIIRELELTYKNRQSPRLLLCFVYCDLAKVIDPRREDWKYKVTSYVEKGLQSVGLSTASLFSSVEQIPQYIFVPEVLFEYSGLMAEIEYSSGRLELVKKWVKVILFLERIYRGGNLEMLKNRFSRFAKVPTLLSEFAI